MRWRTRLQELAVTEPYVPVGGLHAFRNGSDDPASMLMFFAPGAPREEYFERVAEMAQRGGDELFASSGTTVTSSIRRAAPIRPEPDVTAR